MLVSPCATQRTLFQERAMKNNPCILSLAIVFGAAAAPAMADEPVYPAYFQQFFYGAVDIGQSRAPDACVPGANGCSNNTAVARAGLGYQFVPNFGAEVSYGYYGSQSLGVLGPTSLGDWRASGFELSGVGTLPISGPFALTGKIGIARTTYEHTAASHSVATTNLAWGAGVRYNFTDSVAIRAQYEDLGNVGDVTTGHTHIRLVTAGVVLRF
jgi:opacity protein-like surface antigen